jgi:hypothetical protein
VSGLRCEEFALASEIAQHGEVVASLLNIEICHAASEDLAETK